MSNRFDRGIIQDPDFKVERQGLSSILPSVLRDDRGRVKWKNPGNTEEENELLGIKNMQGLLLERFPNFLDLFPFQEDERITQSQIGQAREFILQHAGSRDTFVEIFGESPKLKNNTPYFGGSRHVALAKSFGQWGISFDVDEKEEQVEKEGDITFVSQKKGLSHLFEFIKNGDFSKLDPFTLDVLNAKKLATGTTSFHLGVIEGRIWGLQMPKTLNKASKLYVIPHRYEVRDNNPYYWLEFFPEKGQIDRNLPLESCKLDPDAQTKIDFIYWHSLGEQLLADFILGKNDVKFDDLMTFDMRVHKNPYNVGGVPGLNVDLRNDPVEERGLVRVFPRDEQGLYQWIDIKKVEADIPEELWKKITSFRLFPDKHILSRLRWLGIERQLFSDFMSGDPRIKFENLRPIIVAIEGSEKTVSLGNANGHSIPFNLPPGEIFSSGESIVFIPHSDIEGKYQWVELYRFDPKSNQQLGKCLSQGRMLDGKIDQLRWRGIEIHLFKDFVEGDITFDKLKPIPLTKRKTNTISLWSGDKEKDLSINILKRFDIQEGESLFLIPQKQKDGCAYFLLTRENQTPLGTYKFFINSQRLIPEGSKMTGVEKRVIKRKGYWSIERIESEALVYYLNGRLSNRSLDKSGRKDLAHAILRYYPGQIRRLQVRCRELLDLSKDNPQSSIDDVMAAMLKELENE